MTASSTAKGEPKSDGTLLVASQQDIICASPSSSPASATLLSKNLLLIKLPPGLLNQVMSKDQSSILGPSQDDTTHPCCTQTKNLATILANNDQATLVTEKESYSLTKVGTSNTLVVYHPTTATTGQTEDTNDYTSPSHPKKRVKPSSPTTTATMLSSPSNNTRTTDNDNEMKETPQSFLSIQPVHILGAATAVSSTKTASPTSTSRRSHNMNRKSNSRNTTGGGGRGETTFLECRQNTKTSYEREILSCFVKQEGQQESSTLPTSSNYSSNIITMTELVQTLHSAPETIWNTIQSKMPEIIPIHGDAVFSEHGQLLPMPSSSSSLSSWYWQYAFFRLFQEEHVWNIKSTIVQTLCEEPWKEEEENEDDDDDGKNLTIQKILPHIMQRLDKDMGIELYSSVINNPPLSSSSSSNDNETDNDNSSTIRYSTVIANHLLMAAVKKFLTLSHDFPSNSYDYCYKELCPKDETSNDRGDDTLPTSSIAWKPNPKVLAVWTAQELLLRSTSSSTTSSSASTSRRTKGKYHALWQEIIVGSNQSSNKTTTTTTTTQVRPKPPSANDHHNDDEDSNEKHVLNDNEDDDAKAYYALQYLKDEFIEEWQSRLPFVDVDNTTTDNDDDENDKNHFVLSWDWLQSQLLSLQLLLNPGEKVA